MPPASLGCRMGWRWARTGWGHYPVTGGAVARMIDPLLSAQPGRLERPECPVRVLHRSCTMPLAHQRPAKPTRLLAGQITRRYRARFGGKSSDDGVARRAACLAGRGWEMEWRPQGERMAIVSLRESACPRVPSAMERWHRGSLAPRGGRRPSVFPPRKQKLPNPLRRAPALASLRPFSRGATPRFTDAPVAQLDRALPSEGRGRGFESLRVHQYFQCEQAGAVCAAVLPGRRLVAPPASTGCCGMFIPARRMCISPCDAFGRVRF